MEGFFLNFAFNFLKFSLLKLGFSVGIFGVIGFFLAPSKARAYPSFIGYGYTSCIVCHFNAFGNGPLTDYGRALGATAVAAVPFYWPRASDQDLGETSGFLGPLKFPDSYRVSADYRGLLYASRIAKEGGQTRYINMQVDASLVYLMGEGRSYFVGTLGYIPPPVSGSTANIPKLISREHYWSFPVGQSSRIYAGFQDVVFGIRIPDHTAYSRKFTRLAQNDQVHGINLHLGSQTSEIGIHAFAGNLYQRPSGVRPYGGSVMYEFDIAEKVRLGFSGLYAKSQARSRILAAAHLRAGFGKGSSLMCETGLVSDNTRIATSNKLGNYIFTQTMTRLFRGVHFLFTAEYQTKETFGGVPRDLRVGPGFQYFPAQRLELRADLQGTRVLGRTSAVEESDDLNFLGQLHLWF